MSDFVQTMKDWKRMCDTIKSCNDCPMYKDGWTYVLCSEGGISSARPEVAEGIVTKWAAEHPVVYPTWGEWLYEQGVLGDKYVCSIPELIVSNVATDKVDDPIPADIAQKLGLQPKEG